MRRDKLKDNIKTLSLNDRSLSFSNHNRKTFLISLTVLKPFQYLYIVRSYAVGVSVKMGLAR